MSKLFMNQRFRSSETGTVAILAAIFFAFLAVPLIALVIDTGEMSFTVVKLTQSADAASTLAASVADRHLADGESMEKAHDAAQVTTNSFFFREREPGKTPIIEFNVSTSVLDCDNNPKMRVDVTGTMRTYVSGIQPFHVVSYAPMTTSHCGDCIGGDDVCGPGCTAQNDSDCGAECGAITQCLNDDGCCPAGCVLQTDNDCQKDLLPESLCECKGHSDGMENPFGCPKSAATFAASLGVEDKCYNNTCILPHQLCNHSWYGHMINNVLDVCAVVPNVTVGTTPTSPRSGTPACFDMTDIYQDGQSIGHLLGGKNRDQVLYDANGNLVYDGPNSSSDISYSGIYELYYDTFLYGVPRSHDTPEDYQGPSECFVSNMPNDTMWYNLAGSGLTCEAVCTGGNPEINWPTVESPYVAKPSNIYQIIANSILLGNAQTLCNVSRSLGYDWDVDFPVYFIDLAANAKDMEGNPLVRPSDRTAAIQAAQALPSTILNLIRFSVMGGLTTAPDGSCINSSASTFDYGGAITTSIGSQCQWKQIKGTGGTLPAPAGLDGVNLCACKLKRVPFPEGAPFDLLQFSGGE